MNRDDLVVPGMLTHHEVERALDDYRAELRAKVEGLRAEVKLVRGVERPSASEGALIAYTRVLALLDGSGDDQG